MAIITSIFTIVLLFIHSFIMYSDVITIIIVNNTKKKYAFLISFRWFFIQFKSFFIYESVNAFQYGLMIMVKIVGNYRK
jgi:hypothetical protein